MLQLDLHLGEELARLGCIFGCCALFVLTLPGGSDQLLLAFGDVGLVPLAATSTNWSIRKLGGKRWQALHRLTYLSAICGVIHYWWIVKRGVRTPITITLVLAALLLARIVWSTRQRINQHAEIATVR